MSKYKRLLSILICISVLLSSLVFEGLTAFGENSKGIINGTSVGLRSQPNTSSTRIKNLNYPEEVTILETASGEEPASEKGNGTTWYRVSDSSGTTGYVYGVYVTPVTITSSVDFETQLSKFPESYRSLITNLHAVYPNCKFQADNLDISFEEAVNIQYNTVNRKQVQQSKGSSWYSMQEGSYNWENNTYNVSNGGWISAARSVIAYYIDPRNFINTDGIFMFAQQSYDSSTQTVEMLRSTIQGTFLENGYDGNRDAYITDIMNAASQSGVSPLVLAATIIIEQGVSGSSELISGNSGYYNFFNFGASGATSEQVIASGLEKAKENGWDTRTKSIIGGAKAYSDGYISKGQDTYYYKDFNFVYRYPDCLWHQYAQNIYDAYINGAKLKKAYQSRPATSVSLTFKIPVFKNMPSNPVEKPAENSNHNNFYLTQMNVSGLSPEFKMYTQNYSLSVSGDTTVYLKVPEGASVVSQKHFSLSPGTQDVIITVQAQTGYTNDYKISVTSSAACTLTATTDDPAPEPNPGTDDRGDINGDGLLDLRDFAILRMYFLDIRELNSEELRRANINGDGEVNTIDFALMRMHFLGIKLIR